MGLDSFEQKRDLFATSLEAIRGRADSDLSRMEAYETLHKVVPADVEIDVLAFAIVFHVEKL